MKAPGPNRHAQLTRMSSDRTGLRKRSRSVGSQECCTHFIRTALASRTLATEASPDAFLCRLGLSIADALRSVSETADASRARLGQLCRVVHAAVDSRFELLESSINTAEASKIVALERELVAVDVALERYRTATRAVGDAVSLLSDSELCEHIDLASRLDCAEALVRTLPTAVVEPPHVGLAFDEPALLNAIANCGRATAPLTVTGADLALESTPSRERADGTLRLRVSLGARHAAQSTEELQVSLNFVAGATLVESLLQVDGTEPQPLHSTVSIDAVLRCICITLRVPVSVFAASAAVSIVSISVAGQRVPGPPVLVPFLRGMHVPLRLDKAIVSRYMSPCITPEGLLFAPLGTDSVVHVFDSEGAPLLGLPVAGLGLSRHTHWAAYADGVIPSVILAGTSCPSRNVAIDPSTNAVRWSSTTQIGSCGGIAALPTHGVGFASLWQEESMVIFRLSDGVATGTIYLNRLDKFLASDPRTGTLFGVCRKGKRSQLSYSVRAFLWSENIPSFDSEYEEFVPAAGIENARRPLAIVPPAAGKRLLTLLLESRASRTCACCPYLAAYSCTRIVLETWRSLGLLLTPGVVR